MAAIDKQLDHAHKFADVFDFISIVTTRQEAREAISRGQLAMVLGVEVDNLFNCKEKNDPRRDATCPNMSDRFFTDKTSKEDGEGTRKGEAVITIEDAVDYYYYEKDVRHIFPIHNFDNAFGGAATWQDVIALGNAVSEQRWWTVESCQNEGYGFWIDNDILTSLIDSIGFDSEAPKPIPTYARFIAACNKYGLNLDPNNSERTNQGYEQRGLGEKLIKALMKRGMIIDVDHMSRKSFNDTMYLTTSHSPSGRPYPLVASHVQFFDLHIQNFGDNLGRHERMRTREQLREIVKNGGMVAAMLKDDVQDTDLKGSKVTEGYGNDIVDDCLHSSKTFAQAYQYAVDEMGVPVAFGSDFNGVAGHVGPRFGIEACGRGLGIAGWEGYVAQLKAENRLEYPFTLPDFGKFYAQRTGKRTFDFNTNGLATVGQLPDLVADLTRVGLPDQYIDALFNSTEQYIRVWERAEASANGTQPLTPYHDINLSCSEVCSVRNCEDIVYNNPPTAHEFVAIPKPSNIGSVVTVIGFFDDVLDSCCDTTNKALQGAKCSVNFGDDKGDFVGEMTLTKDTYPRLQWACGKNHTYEEFGIYNITMTFTDEGGASITTRMAYDAQHNQSSTPGAFLVVPEPSDEGSPADVYALFTLSLHPDATTVPNGICTMKYCYNDSVSNSQFCREQIVNFAPTKIVPDEGIVEYMCYDFGHTFERHGVYDITMNFTSEDFDSVTMMTQHSVNNVPPTITSLQINPEQSKEGEEVTVSLTFSDPGSSIFNSCWFYPNDGIGSIQQQSADGNTCTFRYTYEVIEEFGCSA